MGRAPCCDKANVKKGPWSPEEDAKLKQYIEKHGTGGNWISLPQKAGLRRCGKSCRLRWLNYLRPNIKHGEFTDEEDRIICSFFSSIGSRWSIIAAQLPGRTDNDIKNYWNTKLKKKLMGLMMISSSQKTPNQTIPYPSISLLDHQTLEYSYKCSNNNNNTINYYTTSPSTLSFNIGYDQQQTISSIPSILQPQVSYVGPTHQDQVIIKDLFGGGGGDHHQASCSTSSEEYDQYGVSSNNVDHHQNTGIQSYNYSYNGVDENQKIMISNGYEEKPINNGLFGEAPPLMDYGFEEIKQLISTNICNNFNFFVDEINTEEKVMYY